MDTEMPVVVILAFDCQYPSISLRADAMLLSLIAVKF